MIKSQLTLKQVVALVVMGLLVTSAVSGVALAQTQQAESESNNDKEHANSINTGTNVTGEITRNDQDYFAFEAQRGQAITVNFTTADVDGDGFVVWLYSPDDEWLDSDSYSEDRTTYRTIGATATENGTYYVHILGGGDDSPGTYTLTVLGNQSGGAQTEPTSTSAVTTKPTATQSATTTATPSDTATSTSPPTATGTPSGPATTSSSSNDSATSSDGTETGTPSGETESGAASNGTATSEGASTENRASDGGDVDGAAGIGTESGETGGSSVFGPGFTSVGALVAVALLAVALLVMRYR